MTGYANTRGLFRLAGRTRIVVGGVDVTAFRCPDCTTGTFGPHRHTPIPTYSLTEPFAYGATTLSFPQVHAGYERTGQGDLVWAKNGARVQISRVFDDGSETIDYVGEVASVDPTGRELRLDVGGQFSGPANGNLIELTQMYRSERDVGRWASLCVDRLGLQFDPWFGPVTGINLVHTGGQSLAAWAGTVCAMSQDNGAQRVIMPTTWGSNTWHFPVKDTATVHATAFNDDARVVLSVTDDVTEQPNVIYGTCVDPDGVRITNSKWPHVFSGPEPDYPMPGGADMPVGTTDASTVNGDGVTVLYINLRELGYLPWEVANTGTYTSDFATAVKKLQNKAGEAQTGTITPAAWNALFNTNVTGFSINGAYIEPLAEDDRVREWNRAANGAILGRNPLYDPTVPRVERFIDYGPGVRKGAMIRNARGLLARSQNTKNWTGTLTFNNAGLFSGDVSGRRGSLTASDIMPMRDLRPGMNVYVPDFDGGTLFHVAGCDVGPDSVTAHVDTQARDLLEVAAINARDVESRRNLRREWNQANVSAKHSNGLITSDENFGQQRTDVHLIGGQWNVVPMIAGQAGQINKVDIRLTPGTEFAVAILSKPMTPRGKPGVSSRLLNRFGNPLVVADQSWLEKDNTIDWQDDKTILFAAGYGKQPCGYGSRRKFDDKGTATGAPLTGRFVDDNPFPYECAAGTDVIIYLAIYPANDCTLKRGKLLYCQLDSAA